MNTHVSPFDASSRQSSIQEEFKYQMNEVNADAICAFEKAFSVSSDSNS